MDTTVLQRIYDQVAGFRLPRLRENVIFFHVPKCGGSSVDRAITRHYPLYQKYQVNPVRTDQLAERCGMDGHSYRRELLKRLVVRKRLRYITGHFTFNHEVCQEAAKWKFVTLLRDPVRRWFSHFFYNRYKSDDYFKIRMDLPEFVESESAIDLGHQLVCYLAGENVEAGIRSEAAINSAKEAVDRNDVIGVLEDRKHFVEAFERRLGIRLRFGQERGSPLPKAERERQITDAIRRRVEEMCAPDLEVYRYALRRVEREKGARTVEVVAQP